MKKTINRKELEQKLLFIANDEDCPLPDLLNELAKDYLLSREDAVQLFVSMSDFIVNHNQLMIARSEEPFKGVVSVGKAEFFHSLEPEAFDHLVPPYFYLTFRPLHELR